MAGIGGQLTVVTVGLHVYHLTESTLAVALVGLFGLVPTVIAGLFGGALADAFDRRKVALWAAVLGWTSIGGIAAIAWAGTPVVWPLYALTSVNAVAATIIGATRAAIVPRLLPATLLPAASALNGINVGLTVTAGPALAGILVAYAGFGATYTVDVALFSAAFLGILSLPPIVPEERPRERVGESVRLGMAFLVRAPTLRTSFVADIIAMVLGHPRVIYPAAGALLIGGGPVTVGLLSASFAVGVTISSVFSGRVGAVRRQGIAVVRSIQAYGLCVLAFGAVLAVAAATGSGRPGESFSDVRPLVLAAAVACLAGAGASDNISAIFRTSMLQSATPDAFRGRLQGVNMAVVTGGPRVGDLYVGLVASLGLLWLPQLLGGALIVLLVTTLGRMQRGFREYDSLHPRP